MDLDGAVCEKRGKESLSNYVKLFDTNSECLYSVVIKCFYAN